MIHIEVFRKKKKLEIHARLVGTNSSFCQLKVGRNDWRRPLNIQHMKTCMPTCIVCLQSILLHKGDYNRNYMHKYRQNPIVIEKMKAYRKKAKLRIKSYMREYSHEYNQRPEVKAHKVSYRSEYTKRPDVKARRNEKRRKNYRQNPEVKAKILSYMREYNQRPDVKARRKEKLN